MSDTALVESKVNRDIADTIAIGKAGINFANAGEVMEYAKMMAASQSAVPKHLRGQPGACLGILDDAIRFGVNPYALARQSYFVNDQLAYQAAVFMAIINAHAPLKTRPDIKFEGEGQEMRATVTGVFRDGAVREYRSPRVADISPKNSPLWKSDPGQQLSYYSLRGFARRWCPEVIMGIHDVDELREAAMTDVTPAPQAPKSLDDFARAASAGREAAEARSLSDEEVIGQNAGAVVEDPAAESGPSIGDVAGGSGQAESHDVEDAAAASSPPPADHTAVSPTFSRREAIDKMLVLADDPDLSPAEKLEVLDQRRPDYVELLGEKFTDPLLSTTAKLIRGELKPAAARKYLEAL